MDKLCSDCETNPADPTRSDDRCDTCGEEADNE